MSSALQGWVGQLTFMQQTVLLTAIRGPDGTPKYGPCKMLLRFYRRCVLLSAMDQSVLGNPMVDGGGSFSGPSIPLGRLARAFSERQTLRIEDDARGDEPIVSEAYLTQVEIYHLPLADLIADQEREDGWEPLMHEVLGQYLRELDALPHHFQLHFMHAVEILGFKHPDSRIRGWWAQVYSALVEDMHLWPETEAQMDLRLGDNREQWLARNHPATVE